MLLFIILLMAVLVVAIKFAAYIVVYIGVAALLVAAFTRVFKWIKGR